jgi:hypothetical protein
MSSHLGFGWIEEPASAKGNALVGEILSFEPTLPERLDCTDFLDTISSQGGTESCVGHAGVRAIQRVMRIGLKIVGAELPSALQGYDVARGILGWRGLDMGSTIDALFSGMQLAGFCRESACPWDPSRVTDYLDADEYQAGLYQLGLLYHRLLVPDRTLIRHALAQGKGAVAGISVDESFRDWKGNGIWPGMLGPRLGGHAVCLWDYPRGDPRCVNSHGASWGDAGLFTTSWEVIEQGTVYILDAVPRWV